MAFADTLKQIGNSALSGVLNRTYLLQTQTPDGIPRLLVAMDTVDEEDPEFSADVTQHPVEKGPEISDHIQKKNPTLSLKGVISNTPLDLSTTVANLLASGIQTITSSQARTNILNTGLPSAFAVASGAIQGNASNVLSNGLAGAADSLARTALLSAYENALPFDVITRRQRYPSMVISSLKFPRDKETGYALRYEIEMIRLRIVSPLQVQITQLDESVISSGSQSTNLGSQASQEASSQTLKQVNGSWLRSIVKGFGG